MEEITIEQANQLLQKDKEKREQEFANEYDELVKQLCEKYKVNIGISQPQIIIKAL